MPFTFAHAAAALPFRRTRLIFSAVVVGCMAPDFMYFIRLGPFGKIGHTFTGLFVFDLPVGLVVLWLFHRYAKEPLWAWLPSAMRKRTKLGPSHISLGSPSEFALISLSILIGSVTHILWDSFTHAAYWPYRHWIYLHEFMQVPIFGRVQHYKVFQIVSTILGMLLLPLCWMRGPNTSAEPSSPQVSPHSTGREMTVLAVVTCVALGAAAVRAIPGARISHHYGQLFATEAFTTATTVFWIETILYGALRARNRTPAKPELTAR